MWLGTLASRLLLLGSTCSGRVDDGRRWPATQTSRLWPLGRTCWGPGEGVGHHVIYPWDILNVAGVFGDVAEVLLVKKSLGIRETAKDKGEGVHGVMCQQLEGPAINLVTKILDGAKGC